MITWPANFTTYTLYLWMKIWSRIFRTEIVHINLSDISLVAMYSYISSQFPLFDILMLKITHRPRSSLTFTQYPVHLIFGSKKPVTSSCMLGIFKKKINRNRWLISGTHFPVASSLWCCGPVFTKHRYESSDCCAQASIIS